MTELLAETLREVLQDICFSGPERAELRNKIQAALAAYERERLEQARQTADEYDAPIGEVCRVCGVDLGRESHLSWCEHAPDPVLYHLNDLD